MGDNARLTKVLGCPPMRRREALGCGDAGGVDGPGLCLLDPILLKGLQAGLGEGTHHRDVACGRARGMHQGRKVSDCRLSWEEGLRAGWLGKGRINAMWPAGKGTAVGYA